MKKVFKFLAVVILLVIGFALGILYKENEDVIKDNLPIRGTVSEVSEQDGTETVVMLKDLSFYEKYYPNDLAKTMASNKNKDYEMQVGVYETYDEMIAEYFKTTVSLK